LNLRQNGFLLLVLMTLCAIVGQWAPDVADRHLWCLPAGLLLLGMSYELLLVRRAALALHWEVPAHWILARSVAVAAALSHRLARTIEVEIAPAAPDMVTLAREIRVVAVPAGNATQLQLSAVPRRLGSGEFPAMRARVAGALGLAWWSCRLHDPTRFVVVPDMLTGPGRLAGAVTRGARQSPLLGSGGQVVQLRDFRSGDSLRVIDWKASARRDRLISREFSEDQHLDILVGIDAGRASGIWCGELDRLGHYANVTARFAQYATAQDDRVGLVIFGDRPLAALPPGRGTAAVTRIRSILSKLQAQTTDSNPIHAAARIRTLVRHRTLVILLTDIEDAASGSQLAAAVRLLQPKHLPFVAGLSSDAADRYAREPAGSWLDPYRALAGAETRLRRERSILALRAQGVPALVTRPEQLEGAIFNAYADFRCKRRI
jgi:uncharacterized protein (DUF58 family)